MKDSAVLYIIIPCYNEEKVLPILYTIFLKDKESCNKGK